MKYTIKNIGIGHEKVIMSKLSVLIFFSVSSQISQLVLLTCLISCSSLP